MALFLGAFKPSLRLVLTDTFEASHSDWVAPNKLLLVKTVPKRIIVFAKNDLQLAVTYAALRSAAYHCGPRHFMDLSSTELRHVGVGIR